MVREPKGLRRPGPMPLVPLQGSHYDPPLRLGLQLLEVPSPSEEVTAVPPAGRMSAGTCSGAITSPSAAMIMRSTTFRSSRTLFRLHSYPMSRSRAAAATFFRRTPKRTQIPVTN